MLLPRDQLQGTPYAAYQHMQQLPWGAWSLLALYVSLLSGIVVGLQYDYTTPYYSVNSVDLLVPYGEFFRSLHFYSSQLFFLLALCHLAATYSKTRQYPVMEWTKLIVALPVILLLLFTGYVLRADSTGTSAGAIAENIMLTIPLAGSFLDSFFFGIEKSGLRRIYVHHVIGLDILLLFLLWRHLRVYRVNPLMHPHLLALILLFCAVIPAPIEPESLAITYITGPWFFLGLQELLRYIHPLLAGVLHPAVFLVLLLGCYPGNARARYFLNLMWGWLLSYGVLTAVAWLR